MLALKRFLMVYSALCLMLFSISGRCGTTVTMMELNDGGSMPQIGMGVMGLGDKTTKSVKTAIELGYRAFDTAQDYGNEKETYQGVLESGLKRNEVFITTKISPKSMRAHNQRETIDRSIQNLGGEYIDLLLIHWPVFDSIEETWAIMEEYVEKGKVRHIGISNFLPHHLEKLMKVAHIKPAVNQIEIHPYNANFGNAAYFLEKGITVEAWSPLGRGNALNDETLTAIAEKYNKTIAQVILRWEIQRGLIVIPRSGNSKHQAENLDVFDFVLSAEDMQKINSVNIDRKINDKCNPDNFPW